MKRRTTVICQIAKPDKSLKISKGIQQVQLSKTKSENKPNRFFLMTYVSYTKNVYMKSETPEAR